MGAYTGEARKVMIEALRTNTAPALQVAAVGLLQRAAAKTTTSESTTKLKLTAHGFSAGDVLVFTALNGGAGLLVGRPYIVLAAGLETNAFSISMVPAGTAESWTTEVIATSEVAKLSEVSGGSPAYARIATALGAASSKGQLDDSTEHTINVPASTTVNFIGYWSATSAGTLLIINEILAEKFEAQGTMKITDTKLDLLGVA